ncbi:serpin family protein [Hymenobacter glaciei]|uniref:Serpin family protein n=1 Tax=Hymenobacter glaciei TaxID=877209 RepID=A0ABP7UME8_9BACT
MSAFPIFQTDFTTVAQTASSLELLQLAVAADTEKNVAISPLGILAALALLARGADGPTKAALSDVLFGVGANTERAENAFSGWLRQLLNVEDEFLEEAGAILTLASSLWASQPFVLAPEFINAAQSLYNAEVATLDFTASTAALTVNDWVRQRTRGRIDSIVSPESLANLLPPALLLLNAVYFRARWASEFNTYDTHSGPFRLANGTTQQAQLMHQVSTDIGYQAGAGWQAIALPYLSFRRGLSMLIFHPNQPTGLPTFLASLTATNWQSWHRDFKNAPQTEVDLTLPRFRVEWNADLAPALGRLGLTNLFAPGADFAALGYDNEVGGGFIDSVLHKTFLAVDEQGTEAAAVTAIMAMGGSADAPENPPRVVVKVDSPFFYAIVDEADGMLLFAGTVNQLD